MNDRIIEFLKKFGFQETYNITYIDSDRHSIGNGMELKLFNGDYLRIFMLERKKSWHYKYVMNAGDYLLLKSFTFSGLMRDAITAIKAGVSCSKASPNMNGPDHSIYCQLDALAERILKDAFSYLDKEETNE